MKLDLKRLHADARRLKAVRVGSPIGRPKTGATDVIRQQYSEIMRMHDEDGCRWTEIANALAAQGVTQGRGAPLTGRRLTALMRNIALQKENEGKRIASRMRRSDLAPQQSEHGDDQKPKLKLAPELTNGGKPLRQTLISEEDLRRNEFERHAHLIKRK